MSMDCLMCGGFCRLKAAVRGGALVVVVLLAVVLRVGASQYPVLSAAVETNGWVLAITARTSMDGVGTNAANTNIGFFNGFEQNSAPGATNGLTVTFKTLDWDDSGAQFWRERSVYGTKLLRRPYPMQNTNDVQPSSTSNCVIRIALSDWVYAVDTNVTVTVSASALGTTNGAWTNVMATNLTVVNGSTQIYPRPVANWSWPGNQLETNATMRLRAVAFGQGAQDGRPVRLMRFIVTSTNGTTKYTNDQTRMQIDRTLPDLVPTGEYIADIPLSGFIQGEPLRCDFIAYPWRGTNVLYTGDGKNVWPTNTYCQITNRCDKNYTWSKATAVVSLGGSDSNGRATNNTDPTTIHANLHFASIAKAASEIAATNNAIYGHNDYEGGTIYVRTGVTNWVGASATYGNNPRCWLTIRPYPGDVLTITNSVTTDRLGTSGMVRFREWHIERNLGLFSTEHHWFDRCYFSNNATAWLQSQKSVYVTHSIVTNAGANGLTPYGAAMLYNLVRGCYLPLFGKNLGTMVMMGNVNPDTNGLGFTLIADPSVLQPADGSIWYNNIYYGVKDIGAAFATIGNYTNYHHGMAVVQNLFECSIADGTMSFSMGTADAFSYTNFLFWQNSGTSLKYNMGYNSGGAVVGYRHLWSVKNNYIDDWNTKHDCFTTSPGAMCIGGWPVNFGVSFSGNAFPETTNTTAASGTFMCEWAGINLLGNHLATPNGAVFQYPWNYALFATNNGANNASTPTVGVGNYRTRTGSPMGSVKCEWLLPWDLDGVPRGAGDQPGAYVSGNARKGAFF